jgi:hypothetical protein
MCNMIEYHKRFSGCGLQKELYIQNVAGAPKRFPGYGLQKELDIQNVAGALK